MGQSGRTKSQFDNNQVKLNACYTSKLVKRKVAINCFRFIFESFWICSRKTFSSSIWFGFISFDFVFDFPFLFAICLLFVCFYFLYYSCVRVQLDIFRIAFEIHIWYNANSPFDLCVYFRLFISHFFFFRVGIS